MITQKLIKKLKRLHPVEGWRQPILPYKGCEKWDSSVTNYFLQLDSEPPISRYKELARYFIRGFVKYRSTYGARVYYPGAKSIHGLKVDALEGFTRFFPFAAAWVFCTGEHKLSVEGESVDIVQLLHQGIISGVDPESPEFWGFIGDRDQRIVESADVALGLWLSRDYLWENFSDREKRLVENWLLQVKKANISSGVAKNWELFPILVLKVLVALGAGEAGDGEAAASRFEYYKRHYLSAGWFYDSPKGEDFYNAWAIHYTLFWLTQIDPEFNYGFIELAHSEFVDFYRYLFSETGFPAMGRSTCYRIAAPAPILCGTLLNPEIISPGFAYRALDVTWRFFIKQGALTYGGSLTQGYFQENLSFLDNYSGPASALWSLRSLITAFYISKFVPLWNASPNPLPIEVSNYSIKNNFIGWQVEGDLERKIVKLIILRNQGNNFEPIKKYGRFNQALESVFKRPFRPANFKSLYDRPIYSTNSPVVDF